MGPLWLRLAQHLAQVEWKVSRKDIQYNRLLRSCGVSAPSLLKQLELLRVQQYQLRAKSS